MLMRSEPFTEVNRLLQQILGQPSAATWTQPAAMPADAYRVGEEFVILFDLPGVDPDAIDIDVERNVLTVKAERRPVDVGGNAMVELSERPLGVFARQMFLGEALDTADIKASYDDGVLTLRIPVTERAKPRKIAISGREEIGAPKAINAES
jgi:HSP20 family protein